MRLRSLALLAAVAVAIPHAAHAQIGGLVKKAKDAATKKDSTSSGNSNMKPSNTFGPELTASSLDALIRGASASQAKLDQADQTEGQVQVAFQKADAAANGHEKDRQAYDAAREKQSSCWNSEWEHVTAAEQDKIRQRLASDPAFLAEMQKQALEMGRKAAELNAKGDTAGIRKLSQGGMKVNGMDFHADSDVVRKKCGSPPAIPAFLVEDRAARDRASKLQQRERQLQDSAVIVGMATTGMSRPEYNLARERVVNWLHEVNGGPAIQAFGAGERKLLESRKSEIMKLAKTFR